MRCEEGAGWKGGARAGCHRVDVAGSEGRRQGRQQYRVWRGHCSRGCWMGKRAGDGRRQGGRQHAVEVSLGGTCPQSSTPPAPTQHTCHGARSFDANIILFCIAPWSRLACQGAQGIYRLHAESSNLHAFSVRIWQLRAAYFESPC